MLSDPAPLLDAVALCAELCPVCSAVSPSGRLCIAQGLPSFLFLPRTSSQDAQVLQCHLNMTPLTVKMRYTEALQETVTTVSTEQAHPPWHGLTTSPAMQASCLSELTLELQQLGWTDAAKHCCIWAMVENEAGGASDIARCRFELAGTLVDTYAFSLEKSRSTSSEEVAATVKEAIIWTLASAKLTPDGHSMMNAAFVNRLSKVRSSECQSADPRQRVLSQRNLSQRVPVSF